MARRDEWDEDFLDAVMDEVREAIQEVPRARSKKARAQMVYLQNPKGTVVIGIKWEPNEVAR